MTNYSFRAECTGDVTDFILAYRKTCNNTLLKIEIEFSAYPDVDVNIKSTDTIEVIRSVMKTQEDSHVMYESLNYSPDYTGERWYSD